MKLQQILFSQGFGTRRQCDALIDSGAVSAAGQVLRSASADIATDGLVLTIGGEHWPFHERAYVMLHKPAGYECSHEPKHWPSVYELLPLPLRQRPTKSAVNGVQAVGRLDQDTTGLLILSDDGQFIHRMASPKHHVPKVYEVTTKHAVTEADVDALLHGVVLNDDPVPVAAAACERVTPTHLRLTLTEGKYHQVKRMIAAVGNRVEALHRAQMGGLVLDPVLMPGQWRWLTADDLAKLRREAPPDK
ncbi:MAG TPA: 16S rRNA pseudouridine(516) synthase [Casimicrobium huifangae]|uniref:16S rRNA pseudouridine(516) synthase n=1 Tax=Casimicrobium huifangae TaxID=2591109 RepID=UPI0012EC0CE3|nr:16S rRNA pseudouridine(516) synthase [Casimicrobium huifangae]HOB02191.1 16S rRNA pseudouridine(516) synthase [Casimicrobium huifangae]HQA33439.1 16S rRNA pseudouridine(516) synthase [Casimicrobium huifangae]HQD65065.1 16S rRNA pseudouridine(516) synthase [Casimicrobium huifangae]